MEVYLLQLLVGGRGDESIVVGNMLEYESSKQEMVWSSFIGILEVTDILFIVETTHLQYKVAF